MWRDGAFAALGALVAAALSSCFVGGFDKVDQFDTGGGGPGSGGATSTGAAGGVGPGGSTGGGTNCEDLTCTAGEGEQACCFSHPSQGDVCGRSVDDYPVNECLPLASPGMPDASCPSTVVGGRTLVGCCLDTLGMCGVLDPAHEDLGCVGGDAVGLEFQSCGTPGCGTFCQSAIANGCLSPEPLGVYDCALECAAHSESCPSELSSAADCGGEFVACDDTGFAILEGCENRHATLLSCWGNEDCSAYCQGVNATCTGAAAQYETIEQCAAACAVLDVFEDHPNAGDDTLACRMARISQGSDPNTCATMGPAGAADVGVCGTACQSFCILDELVCNDVYVRAFPGGFSACEAACESSFPAAGQPYATTGLAVDSAECRLYHLVLAADPMFAADKQMLCAAANGEGTACP